MSAQTRVVRRPAPPDEEKLPPHALDAEAAVLGCLLLAPRETLDTCDEEGVTPLWFYDPRHVVLFVAARKVLQEREALDTTLLVTELAEGKQLENVGGFAYLAACMDRVASASQVKDYLRILEEAWVRRSVLRICVATSQRAYEVGADIDVIVGDAQREIAQLSEQTTRHGERSASAIMPAVIDSIEDYHRGSAQQRGMVTTGLEYLDKILCGVGGRNGNFVVVSARPGMGKTALAMQVASHTAIDYEYWTPDKTKKRGLPVAVFSMEMVAESLVERMVFERAKADMQRFRNGFAYDRDFDALQKATEELAAAPIYIEDEGRMTIASLKAKARRMYRTLGVRLFVVDYIQLMRADSRRFREDRVQELAEISGELQCLAKELCCPFLTLAQMNRDYEKEPNRAPRLSDLKDCGAIEQDADVVIFLHRPRLKGEEADQVEQQLEKVAERERDARKEKSDDTVDWTMPYRVDALVAKNRFGPSDKVARLLFHRGSLRFEDLGRWQKTHGFKGWADGDKKPKETLSEEEAIRLAEEMRK